MQPISDSTQAVPEAGTSPGLDTSQSLTYDAFGIRQQVAVHICLYCDVTCNIDHRASFPTLGNAFVM